MTLESVKRSVIEYGGLVVSSRQDTFQWLLDIEQVAVRMAEEGKLQPKQLAALMREIGQVDRCITLTLFAQDDLPDAIRQVIQQWCDL